jgi:hypothetical protein
VKSGRTWLGASEDGKLQLLELAAGGVGNGDGFAGVAAGWGQFYETVSAEIYGYFGQIQVCNYSSKWL